MNDHFPNIAIKDLNLPLEEDRSNYDGILEQFFNEPSSTCTIASRCARRLTSWVTTCSEPSGKDVKIMGYDMVGKNAGLPPKGSISFLIAQHGYMQGYECVESLFNAIVLKQKVPTRELYAHRATHQGERGLLPPHTAMS